MLIGFTRTLSRVIYAGCVSLSQLINAVVTTVCQVTARLGTGPTRGGRVYLFAALCVEQDPSKLNHLGRILRDVYTMFIAGGGDMDDHRAVEVGLLTLGGGCHAVFVA